MEKYNFKDLGVSDLNLLQMKYTNGGWPRLAYAWVVDTITHWNTYREAFLKGYNETKE